MYSTIQGKALNNLVHSGQAKGTFRSSQVLKRLSDGVLGFRVVSGDAADSQCQAGIIWLPGKNYAQVLSTATKFVMGYYTPHV